MSVCAHWLQIQWSLLVEEVAPDGVNHILRGHHVSMEIRLAVGAVELANGNLSDELVATRAFLAGIKFIYTHNNITQRADLRNKFVVSEKASFYEKANDVVSTSVAITF